jgi:monofunctional biosynthetic peptidoglycan transglycosylase
LGQGWDVARRRSLFKIVARAIGLAAVALVCLFVGLIALYAYATPVSTLMLARKIEGKAYERLPVRLGDVAPSVIASVIASEDATFCQNDGVDWGALHEVIDRSRKVGRTRGASTITMQTAKNLFLWPGRSVLRKSVEIPIALVLGKVWSKRRTLEIYLNIAEWGDGIFGVEAAARRYFHKHASELDAREAALLATSLPNPIERNPSHPKPFQQRLAAALEAKASRTPEAASCLAR